MRHLSGIFISFILIVTISSNTVHAEGVEGDTSQGRTLPRHEGSSDYPEPREFWSTELPENDHSYGCPDNYALAGYEHNGDENGWTKYLCRPTPFRLGLSFIAELDVLFTTSMRFKESNHEFRCPAPIPLLVSRSHEGDENGSTKYECLRPDEARMLVIADYARYWAPPHTGFACPPETPYLTGRERHGDENSGITFHCIDIVIIK